MLSVTSSNHTPCNHFSLPLLLSLWFKPPSFHSLAVPMTFKLDSVSYPCLFVLV